MRHLAITVGAFAGIGLIFGLGQACDDSVTPQLAAACHTACAPQQVRSITRYRCECARDIRMLVGIAKDKGAQP
jgi:hypothetical protein